MTPIDIGFGILSALMVGAYIVIARRSGWLDNPNQRSSHTRATPRGAGIVMATLVAVAALYYLRPHLDIAASILLGLVVAITGWCDDLRGLSARSRFIVYAGCAAAVVLLVLRGNTQAIHSSWLIAATLLGAIGLLWLINLYNFMDGIDGIAAFEALFVLAAALWLSSDLAMSMHAFIRASLFIIGGFLLWNFPVAQVFMGDAGSAFLGFLLGTLALWSTTMHGPQLVTWLILLGVFIVDASYTLLVRIATGQSWRQAHRSHAYQIVSRRLGHPRTVVLVALLNVGWLLPWAWLLQNNWVAWPLALALAYSPLLAICCALKAGIRTTTGV